MGLLRRAVEFSHEATKELIGGRKRLCLASICLKIIAMTVAEIKEMSKIERLQAMETLWDSFCDEADELESPEWHKDVLAERKAMIDSGEAKLISLEELKDRVKR